MSRKRIKKSGRLIVPQKRLTPALATPENPFGIEIGFKFGNGNNIVYAPGLHARTWGQYIDRADGIEDFPEDEKKLAIERYRFLEKEFGNDWLVMALDGKHQLAYFIEHDGNRSRRWLSDFGRDLMAVHDQKNYESVIARLRHAHEFDEGLDVLRMAARFVRAGFAVEIDFRTKVRNKDREPDLRLVNRTNREVVIVEITSLHASEHARKANRTYSQISEELEGLPSGTIRSGKIVNPLDDTDLDDVKRKVHKSVLYHRTTGRSETLVLPGMIALGLAREVDRDSHEEWCRRMRVEVGSFEGPEGYDSRIRTGRKLRRKARDQLPRNTPGIVVVGHDAAFQGRGHIQDVVTQLEPSVTAFKQMVFAVVIGHLAIDKEDIEYRMGRHLFLYRHKYGGFAEKYLLIDNSARKVSVTEDTLTRLWDAFRIHH